MNIEPPKQPNQPPDRHFASEMPVQGGAAPPTASPPGSVGQPELTRKPSKLWREALLFIALVAGTFSLAFLVVGFGLRSYEVDGQSMETTLQNRDWLVVDKIPRTWARVTHHAYIPKRGNIIVFNQAGLFGANGLAEKQLIKRVIGLPGDRVVVKDGKITIYNKQHPGGFNPDNNGSYKIAANYTSPGNYSDVTLKTDQLFVCGDNRPNSEDSRYFGPINANQIVGQLILRVIPLSNAERF